MHPAKNSFNHPTNLTFMLGYGFLSPDSPIETAYEVWGRLRRAAHDPVEKWAKMSAEERIAFKEKIAGVLEFRAPQPVTAE